MKAITAVCATGASVPAIINGRVSRHRDGENAEIQMYLSKLKDLVPFMPKNRKLSKLEIIQHVIDYICDLQSELETHPAVNNFDAAAALNGQSQQHEEQLQQQYNNYTNNSQAEINAAANALRVINSNQHQDHQDTTTSSASSSSALSSPPQVRQPLCDRPVPNTILSATHNSPLSSPTLVINGQLNHSPINSQIHLHTTTEKETTNRQHC